LVSKLQIILYRRFGTSYQSHRQGSRIVILDSWSRGNFLQTFRHYLSVPYSRVRNLILDPILEIIFYRRFGTTYRSHRQGSRIWFLAPEVEVISYRRFCTTYRSHRQGSRIWFLAPKLEIISYRRFGTTYRSHRQGSRIWFLTSEVETISYRRFGTTYRSHRQGSRMGPTGYAETSVTNYHCSLRNNPE